LDVVDGSIESGSDIGRIALRAVVYENDLTIDTDNARGDTYAFDATLEIGLLVTSGDYRGELWGHANMGYEPEGLYHVQGASIGTLHANKEHCGTADQPLRNRARTPRTVSATV